MVNKKIEITFCASGGYILTSFKGTLELEEIEGTFQIIVTSKAYSMDMGTIWDLSEADLSELDYRKVKKASALGENCPNWVGKARVALVSSRDINLPLLNLCRLYVEEKRVDICVFSSLDAARSWVN